MTPPDLAEIWVYLAQKPLTGLTLTLSAYVVGDWFYEKSGRHPLLNPVPIAIALIAGLLWVTGVPYQDYFDGAQFVHFLLGPATVALAVPLYQQIDILRKSGPALLAGVLLGSMTAAGCAWGFAFLGGASTETVLSIIPKSVTAAIAMGISDQLGGLPSLTAVLVILTGITGAVLGPLALNLAGIQDWRARGLAMGVAAHGIGTARAMQVNAVAGAFAGLAMGLNGLATAILVPLIFALLS
ncbi:MAG: LrgB family protein [Rhodospirillales bacterium]|nr:LrgB family protein [Rhodospirillales bacterium]